MIDKDDPLYRDLDFDKVTDEYEANQKALKERKKSFIEKKKKAQSKNNPNGFDIKF